MAEPETINTLEQPGEFDVLHRLRPNEPYLALVGRDPKAPPLILTWAWAQREWAMTLPEGDYREKQLRKATQAEQIAWAMDEYREGIAASEAAAAAPEKPYSGVQLDEATIERSRQHTARVHAAQIASRAFSELNDEADVIERNDPELADAIRAEVDRLRAFHEIIALKRPIIDTSAELPLETTE